MFQSSRLASQIAEQHHDSLRVLISGAGVAGTTLAGLLRKQGLHPVVIERSEPDASEGYMLALLPLVTPVLERLGIRDAYHARSQAFDQYVLHGRHGQRIGQYSMTDLLGAYGDYRGIDRGSLLDVLTGAGLPVAFATTIAGMQETGSAVDVVFAAPEGPATGTFDLVVIAEGLHSSTRRMILPDAQVETVDTGWGGWIAWIDADPEHPGQGEEFWGAGCFAGMYPVKDRTGVIVCGNREDTAAGTGDFVRFVRQQLGGRSSRCDQALDAVEHASSPYYWKLTDSRSARWTTHRTVLLGDAAAGFLPTAGVGAAMAMEAAGVLAAHLDGIGPDAIATAIATFEQHQKPRTEAAQTNSRQLARLMFHRSPALAVVRDLAIRFVPLRVALGPIRKLHTQAPEF